MLVFHVEWHKVLVLHVLWNGIIFTALHVLHELRE